MNNKMCAAVIKKMSLLGLLLLTLSTLTTIKIYAKEDSNIYNPVSSINNIAGEIGSSFEFNILEENNAIWDDDESGSEHTILILSNVMMMLLIMLILSSGND